MIYNPPLFGYINTPEGWHYADRTIPPFLQMPEVERPSAAQRYITRCGQVSTYQPEPAPHGNSIVYCAACQAATE